MIILEVQFLCKEVVVPGEDSKVPVVTKIVVTACDQGHYGSTTCGACGTNVEVTDKSCPGCRALFSKGLDINYSSGGSDF